MKEIGQLLKDARKSKELTQQQVADAIGIGLRDYQHYEAGRFPKHKRGAVPALEKLLEIDIYDKIYHSDNSEYNVSEPSAPYLSKRRILKNEKGPLMVPLVSVSAQAGYSKSYDHSDFINQLEHYPILPGVDPHGAIWRYFQVDGDSMHDVLENGTFVLSSQVPKEDWNEIKDFMVYVIVTEFLVTIKYAVKRGSELILIPKNKSYKQIAVPFSNITEIWKYRRHIDWNVSAGEMLTIEI